MKRLFLSITIILMAGSLLFAGGTQESSPSGIVEPISEESAYPKTITDSRGYQVVLESEPMRVVSLAPNMTEIIYAIGAGETLVGRTDWCDFPAGTADVMSVGSLQEPSIEAILALAPDLVIGSTHAPLETLDMIEQAGIRTLALVGHEEYVGVYDLINYTADALDAEEGGAALIADMKARSAMVEAATASISNSPRVYYVVGYGEGGDWTATGDTFIHKMLTLAGGTNIAAEAAGWSFSLEKLVEEDPDIIIVNKGLTAAFSASPIYSGLRAVKEGRVLEIDENTIVRQGPRLIDGLESLSSFFVE